MFISNGFVIKERNIEDFTHVSQNVQIYRTKVCYVIQYESIILLLLSYDIVKLKGRVITAPVSLTDCEGWRLFSAK